MTLSGDPQYPSPYGPPSGPPPAPARPRPVVADPVTGWVLLVLGIAVVTGSTAEWASVGASFTSDGTDGDGSVTLAFGIVVAVMGLLVGLRVGRLWASAVAFVFALSAALTAVLDVANLTGDTPLDDPVLAGDVSVSWGLWTVLVAALLALAASATGLLRRR